MVLFMIRCSFSETFENKHSAMLTRRFIHSCFLYGRTVVGKSNTRTASNKSFQHKLTVASSEQNEDPGLKHKASDNTHIPPAFAGKYRVFKDEESPMILDVEEERSKNAALEHTKDYQEFDEFAGISLERGVTGVMEIEELVDVLRMENVSNIFVAEVPPEYKYVNYIVVVTGKSMRHMYATAEFVRRVFKQKRNATDIIPKIEGEDSKDWIAMDLGNIALHIFSKTARSLYDLESLWSVGVKYDSLANTPADPLVDLIMKHSIYLGDTKPEEVTG